MIFGRTDLRIGVYGANFDAEADFDVRFAVGLQKSDEKYEKLNFRSKFFGEKKIPASKNEILEIV